MQNALAIIPFPLGPVQSAPSDLDPAVTSPDFAVTFAADLTELAGDTPVVDPDVVATDQSVAWVVPIQPVSAVLPVGVQAVFGADGMTGDIGLAAGVADSNAGQGLLPIGNLLAAGVSEAGPSKAVDLAAARLGADVAPGRGSEGAIVADTTFTELAPHAGRADDSVAASDKPQAVSGAVKADAEPAQEIGKEIALARATSPEGVQTETPAAPGVSLLKRASTGAVLNGMHGPTPDTNLVGESVAQGTVTESEPVVLDRMTEKGSPVAKMLATQLVDAMATSPMLPAVARAAGEFTLEKADPAILSSVASTASVDPESAARITLPGAEAEVAAARTVAPTLLSEPRTPASFWERYLANGVDPQPGSELVTHAKPLPGNALLEPASLTPGTVGLTPLLVPGKDGSDVDLLPLDEVPAPTGADSEIFFNAPSTYQAPSPVPLSTLDQVPILTVLPWSAEPADLVGDLDIGATQSFLSPVSTPAASPVASGSLSLPVQMVAVQLAGVLVQASDRVTELALAPEELGKVRLRMEQDAANPDRLTILINVERPETLDLFRRHAGELADAIRNAGYSGAQIDFGHRGQDGGGQQDHGRSSAGMDLSSDEVAPIQHSPRMMAGATLDLRL